MMDRTSYEIVYSQLQGVTSGKYWLLGISRDGNGWSIRRRVTGARPLVEFQMFVDEPSAFKIITQVFKAATWPINMEAFRDLVLMLHAMYYATRGFIGRG